MKIKYYKVVTEKATEIKEFTQIQADEFGAILDSDGLNAVIAGKLCERWNFLGKPNYTYSLE